MNSLLRQYQLHLQAQKKISPSTRANYLSDLNYFFTWLQKSLQETEISLTHFTPAICTGYRQYLTALPVATANRRLSSLRHFGQYLFSTQQLDFNFSDHLSNLDMIVYPKESLKHFAKFLTRAKLSPTTVNNYVSDVNQSLNSLLSLKDYQKQLRSSSLPLATLNRKLSSLRRYQEFTQEHPVSIKPIPTTQTKPNSINLASLYSYVILPIIILFSLALGIFGYNQIFKQVTAGLAYPQAPSPTTPNRYLSFQARLTDSSANPITVPTDMRFILYNSVSASGSAKLWEEQRYLDPDQDGIFSVELGTQTSLPSSVFTENANLWLGVTVETDAEATPRQPIATVGYALNAETLQGFPPSASASADQIPVLTQEGDLYLAAAAPMIYSSSGTFSIKGQALTLTTATGTNGDIQIAPDGTGNLDINLSSTAQNAINITNANQTSGHLISGYVGNDTATGDLLNLSSGSTAVEKFTVDRTGQCIEENSLINTSAGYKKIKDVQPGDQVLSLNETTGKFEYQAVEKTLDMGFKEIYELTTETGKKIETTANHPYLVKTKLLEESQIDQKTNNQHQSKSDLRPNININQPIIESLFHSLSSHNNFLNLKAITRENIPAIKLSENTVNQTGSILINSNISPTWLKVIYLKTGDEIGVYSGSDLNGSISPKRSDPNGKLQFETISSIRILPPKHVYDLQIANTHNFVANGIVAHNTYISGSVGIGTTAPSQKLEVVGTVLATDFTCSNCLDFPDLENTLDLDAATEINLGAYNLTIDLSSTGDFIIADGGVPTHIFNDSGNVGIGTTAPAAKLHSLSTTEQLRLGYSTTNYVKFTVDGSSNLAITNHDGNVELKVNYENIIADSGINGGDNDYKGILARGYGGRTGAANTKSSIGGLLQGIVSASNTQNWTKAIGLIGVDAETVITAGATGTITGAAGIYTTSTINAGTVTNLYGAYIAAPTGVGTITFKYALVTEAGAGNVGIGTTAPAAPLHIQGILTGEQLRLDDISATGNPYMSFYQTGTRRAFIQSADTNDNLILASEYGALSFKAAATAGSDTDTEYMRIIAGGKVGIGTTGPISKLMVQSGTPNSGGAFSTTPTVSIIGNAIAARTDATVQQVLYLHQPNSQAISKGSGFGIGLSFWEDPGSNYPRTRVDFQTTGRTTDQVTAGNTIMSLRDDGNVGIGTTAPTVKLQVAGGSIRIGTPTSGDANPYIDFYSTTTDSKIQNVNGHLSLGHVGGTEEALTVLLGGNVGIGTTGPLSTTHIYGNAAGAVSTRGLTIQQDNAGAHAPVFQFLKTRPTTLTALDNDYSGYINFDFYDDNATPVRVNGAQIVSKIIDASDTTEDADLYFTQMVAGTLTEVMRLNNGNVGIGTTGPEQLLHIQGASGLDGATPVSLELKSTSAGTWTTESILGQIIFNTSDASGGVGTIGAIKSYIDDTAGADYGLSFWTTTSGAPSLAEAMRIDHLGNVGIGTAAPGYNLEVDGTFDFDNGTYNVTSDANSSTLYMLNLTRSTTSLTTIGSVGIGTTAPLSKLSVGGVGNSNYTIYGTSAGSAVIVGDSTGSGGTGVLGYNSTTGYGVYAQNAGATGYGIYCNSGNTGGCAGNRAWTPASDTRLKKNIVTIPNALDKVMHLRGVDFNWIDGGQADTGFIAQEVLPIVPQVVSQDARTGMYGVRTSQLTGLLVEAVKEQQGQISSLSAQLASLTLTDTGDIVLTGDSPETYAVATPVGTASRVEALASLFTAKLQSGYANIKETFTDTLTVSQKIISPIVETDTLIATSIDSPTIDLLREQIDNLTANLTQTTASVAAIPQFDSATYAALIELVNAPVATDTANYISLNSVNAKIANADLANINSSAGTLNFLAGLMILDRDGQTVTFNADVTILGKITAPIASFTDLTAKKIIADEIKVNQLIIASDATASAQIASASASITTNATAGKAILPAGLTELKIENSKIDNSSLIYLTPIGDSQNQVIYVKAKKENEWFTVGLNQPLPYDLEFNWWIIKLEP